MIKKKYPLLIFGIIGVYHIAIHFVNYEYKSNRDAQLKKAEEELQQRFKNI